MARPSRFRQTLAEARRALWGVAAAETLLAALAGGAVGLLVALVLVGTLPFSVELRACLWAVVALAAVGAGGVVAARRLLPLRKDRVVAGRLEEAARLRGAPLDGTVLGAVELLEGDAASGGSPSLAAAHVAFAEERLRGSGASGRLLNVGVAAARRTLAAAVLAALAFAAAGGLAPGALADRWAMLFDDEAARRALEEEARNLLPLVTDLELTLRFPAYMNRPEQVVKGASGDIVAPRGTEVHLKARADRLAKAAALLYGEQVVRLDVEGGRALRGSFVVDEAGSYRFRLTTPRDETELGPIAHRITLAPDHPPEVALLEPESDRVVQLDESVALRFSAEDDYGLTRFRLVVLRKGGGRVPFEKDLLLVEDLGVKKRAASSSFTPAEVGARAGDELSVYVEALDNDTVSGPKAGRSATRVLTVFSAAAHHRELIDLQQRLQDAMVDVLADELEAPVPKDPESDAAARARHIEAQLVASAHGADMMKLLDQVLRHLADDEMSPPEVGRALRNMRTELARPFESKQELVQNAKNALDNGRKILAYVFTHLRTYQRELTTRLEKHILYLDDLLGTQRLREAEQIAEEMKRTQEGLKALIEQYKKEPSDAVRAEILAEIERLKEQLAELAQRLAELQRDVPDEYLNEEAFQQEALAENAMDLDRMIEEGRLDDALKAIEQMMQSTEQMLGGIDESQEQYGDDEYGELREKMRAFGEELKALKAEQEDLAHRSDRMLEAARQEAMRRLEGGLDQKLEELKRKTKEARKQLAGIDPSGLFGPEQEDTSMAEARLADLEAALEAQDIEDALEAVREAESAARSAERTVADRTRGRWGARGEKTLDARARLESARPTIEEIHDELAGLLPDPAAMLSEPQKRQLQKDARRQSELKERADRLAEMMQEISEEMPVFGPSHQQQVGRAGQKMREAGQQLQREDLREGRSAQRQALHALNELEGALEQMGREGQGQGGTGGVPMPLPGGHGSEGGRDEDGNGRNHSDDEVKIPGAEDFEVPDAFRRDILDAMREGAPDEWEPEVKRYYEGLVK